MVAEVGDTVTYTFSVSDCTQKITGIRMVIFFDQTALSLEEVNADNLTGNTIINDNVNNNGQIIITNSFVNGSKGLDCSEKTTIVTATFKVIAPVETEITYYMPYLYDMEVVNIYDYTFTYTLDVTDAQVIRDRTPVLASLEQAQSLDDMGDFENTVDGRAEHSDVNAGDDTENAAFESTEAIERKENEDDACSESVIDGADGATNVIVSEVAQSSLVGLLGILIALGILLVLAVVAVIIVIIIIVIVASNKKKQKQQNNTH